MHVLKTGCRWVDCPPEYGPHKTIYNRFNRWSAQGIWQSNVIERCYCRLKDFRRIATRYDKLARSYFSALCLVAAVVFWF
jgi:transposase